MYTMIWCSSVHSSSLITIAVYVNSLVCVYHKVYDDKRQAWQLSGQLVHCTEMAVDHINTVLLVLHYLTLSFFWCFTNQKWAFKWAAFGDSWLWKEIPFLHVLLSLTLKDAHFWSLGLLHLAMLSPCGL